MKKIIAASLLMVSFSASAETMQYSLCTLNDGKSMADANTVIGELLIALDSIASDGPPDKNGELKWVAFDWQSRCSVKGAAVYGTAGMRIAEKQDARNSALLWKNLNDSLSEKLGMSVTTRTLTEYEEGLYSWLALRELRTDGNFGVAEMGGASVQITLPCPECKTSRQVKVKGRAMPIYSYSYLGWGQDEARKNFGPLPACTPGVGKKNQEWEIADCAAGMEISSDAGAELKQYIETRGELRWYLSGAFRHMRNTAAARRLIAKSFYSRHWVDVQITAPSVQSTSVGSDVSGTPRVLRTLGK